MNQFVQGQGARSQGLRWLSYTGLLYLALYLFPFPLDLLTGIIQRFFNWMGELLGWQFLQSASEAIDRFWNYWRDLWQWMIPWVGKHLLHLKTPITTFSNGSGDTTYDWIMMPVMALLAMLGAGLWMLRRRPVNMAKVQQWCLLIVRYYIAYNMLSYGFAKVIQSQFPYPNLLRLAQPYGESSPMGLAWTFMGYSYGYNLFTGGCEVVAGLLLLFRRTQTFGALFAMTVCTTIFVMNLCYDIPVKLFSFHLLVFSGIVAAADGQRIVTFFFRGKQAQLHQSPWLFANWRWARYLRFFKWFLLVYMVYTNVADTRKGYYEYGMGAPKPPLYGIYNAQLKIVNNDTIALRYNDTLHWKQLIIVYDDFVRVRLLNDSARRYAFKADTVAKQVVYYPVGDTSYKYRMAYQQQQDLLWLRGNVKGDSVQMLFRRYDESKYLLNNRGFNWVNEFPFNR
jgi:uncharacterized membrane protein YphA (DoxX/SURF4 family)